MRYTLTHDMTPEEGVEEMVEGDEGALFVITEIVNNHVAPHTVLLDLDDMNIRGEQIKIGVTACGGSIREFVIHVTARSQWLCDEINREYSKHKAVTQGASHRRE